MEKYLIYGLYCPFTEALHYVGKSTTYMIRPLSHLTKSHSEKINEWVKELKILGYKPIIKIIENCTKENIDEREIYWITKSIDEGCYLLNKSHNSTNNILMQSCYADNITDYSQLIQTINSTRISKGITRHKLCKDINLSRTTFYSLEKGCKSTTINNLLKVLNYLGLIIKIE